VDKAIGQFQGTVRLTSSKAFPDVLPGFVPHSTVTDVPFTFVDRFAVRPGVDQQVGAALMKALWLWAGLAKTESLVALAQRILVKHYAKWGGLRLLGNGEPLEVPEHLKEPVYFVGARLSEAHAQVLQVNPAFEQFVLTHHAELQLPPPEESLPERCMTPRRP
jgi:hypothetical protein